jgi:hypothetical protein
MISWGSLSRGRQVLETSDVNLSQNSSRTPKEDAMDAIARYGWVSFFVMFLLLTHAVCPDHQAVTA